MSRTEVGTTNPLNPRDTTPLDARGLCSQGRRHGEYGCEYHPAYVPLTPEECTPEAVAARELASDKSYAADPYTSLSDLKALASHPHPDVRWSLAGNRVVKGALLTRLLKDADPRVRAQAVANDNTTKRQAESMLGDRDDWTRSEARRRLGMEQETSTEADTFHVPRDVMREILASCESVDDLRESITIDDRLSIGSWNIAHSEGRSEADDYVADYGLRLGGRWLTTGDGSMVFVALRGRDHFCVTDVAQAA